MGKFTREDAANTDEIHGMLQAGFTAASEALAKLSDGEVSRVRGMLTEYGMDNPDAGTKALFDMVDERMRCHALKNAESAEVFAAEEHGAWFVDVSIAWTVGVTFGTEVMRVVSGQPEGQAKSAAKALQEFLSMAGIKTVLGYQARVSPAESVSDELPF